MMKEKINEALNNIDISLVEEFVLRKEEYRKKRKAKKRILSISALAACLCIAIGIASVLPKILSQKKPSYTSTVIDLPNGIPMYNEPIYSASDIGKMFGGVNDGGTSYYKKVYAPSDDYLITKPIEINAAMEVYEYTSPRKELDQMEFSYFFKPIIFAFSNATGAEIPEYDVRISGGNYQGKYLSVDLLEFGKYSIIAQQRDSCSVIDIFSLRENNPGGSISLNGVDIKVDQTLSDEDIAESVNDIKAELFSLFGVEFRNIKVVRKYNPDGKYGVDGLYIYFYDELAHPLNKTQEKPVSDYIELYFDNSKNYEDDVVSNTFLTSVDISYFQNRADVNDIYKLSKKIKGIPFAEAEELLYKGYVFGGHNCKFCMEAQEKVDFHGYEYVELVYLFGYDEKGNMTEALPFYAFYKSIGVSENGNTVYAKTYVPTIPISGWEEYFEAQSSKHITSVYE